MIFYILNKFPIKEINDTIFTSRIVFFEDSLSDIWKDMSINIVANNVSLYDLIFNPNSKVLDNNYTLNLKYIKALNNCILILESRKLYYTMFDSNKYKDFVKFLHNLYNQLILVQDTCNRFQIYVK